MQRKYSGSAKGALVNSWTWQIYLDKTNRQQNQQWLREDPRHVVYGPLGQNETFSSLLNSKKLLGGFYSGRLKARNEHLPEDCLFLSKNDPFLLEDIHICTLDLK